MLAAGSLGATVEILGGRVTGLVLYGCLDKFLDDPNSQHESVRNLGKITTILGDQTNQHTPYASIHLSDILRMFMHVLALLSYLLVCISLLAQFVFLSLSLSHTHTH